jgi:thymidylate kinase
MRLIIEGCDGVGKTSIIKKLAEEYNLDIFYSTYHGPKKLNIYRERLQLNDIVFDRSFISEFVYSKILDRESEINLFDFNYLLKTAEIAGFKIIILTCEVNEIIRRLNERKDEMQNILSNIKKIELEYEEICSNNDIIKIDTTNKSIQEIVEKIKEKVEHGNY